MQGTWWHCNDERVVEKSDGEAMETAKGGSVFFYERDIPADTRDL